jgi:hypothetical protein
MNRACCLRGPRAAGGGWGCEQRWATVNIGEKMGVAMEEQLGAV